MLTIRPDQLQALDEHSFVSFEDEMAAHCRGFAPSLCREMDEGALRAALRRILGRAGAYGFTLRGPLRIFIEMTLLFGHAFDTDPLCAWTAQILQSPGEQMRRAGYLYDGILDYQQKVAGTAAVNTRQALAGLARLARRGRAWNSEGFADHVQQQMWEMFPRKARSVGRVALSALIEEAAPTAERYELREGDESASLLLWMFIWGHDCASDPFYPWIGRTLRGLFGLTPASRLARLKSETLQFTAHLLAAPTGNHTHD